MSPLLALILPAIAVGTAWWSQAWAEAGAPDRGLNVEPDRREETSR
jgi:hypothetical protein